MNDGKLDPVIVSSCIFMEDETAEKTVESIEDKVSIIVCCSWFPTINIDTNIQISFNKINRIRGKVAYVRPLK